MQSLAIALSSIVRRALKTHSGNVAAFAISIVAAVGFKQKKRYYISNVQYYNCIK